MALDPAVIGARTPAHSVDVERGRLRFFAKATGQSDTVWTDVEAAKAAGHRDLPVPPTFLFCLDMERPNPSALFDELSVDIRTILHGGQEFEYLAPAYAGDRLTFATEVTDLYSKKGGALQFLVRTTEVTRDGELVARLRGTVVIREIPVKEAAA